MNPNKNYQYPVSNEQLQSSEQQPFPSSPVSVQPKKSNKLAIFLIVWPIVLIPLLLALNAIVAITFPNSLPTPDNLFGTESPVKRVMNLLMFTGMAVNILLGLPSFITGIVLLVKRKS